MKWVICGAGPSMARVDLELLKDRQDIRVMVVNCTFRLLPFADALYAGDTQWWERYGEEAMRFGGPKWTASTHAAIRHALGYLERRTGRGLCRDRRAVFAGGNSGYEAVNLAYHLGARQIVLLGFDMHRRDGGHWHEEHEGMLSAPAGHMEAWRRGFEYLAADLLHEGVDVVNATEGSALTCFRKGKLRDCV